MQARDRYRASKQLRLRDEDAAATPLRDSDGNGGVKQRERALTAELTEHIARLQEMLFAQRQHKLLVILQGMDTSGKDGTVRSLFSHINPMGLNAVQFKAPSADEAAHDFLWRVHRHVPAAGEIAIFNRSHYEDVLVPFVQGQIDDAERQRRLGHIAAFERMLAETGTVVVKLFLHISYAEQGKRLQERIDNPDKHWKFDEADLEQRRAWRAYQHAYAYAIDATDASHAPWYIIPADSKTHRNLQVATLLLEVLQGMKLAFPPANPKLGKLKID